MSDTPTVIIGASHAGVTAAGALRKAGHQAPILLVSAEDALPYHRPPLSKAYLKGEKTPGQIALRGEKFYADNDITLLRGTRATGLDAQARTVTLDGAAQPYGALVLATGARARPLPGTEDITAGLSTLRDLSDADALRGVLAASGRLVIIGGGFIGLEVAASAVNAGLAVTVIEPLPALLRRALPAEVSEMLLAHHRQMGVDIRLATGVEGIDAPNGRVQAVRLATGERLAADHVLVGIGSTARLELAEQAGLAMHLGGIQVDSHGRTSIPDIYAIGDCATQENPHAAGWIRLESVQAAGDQANAVAHAIADRAADMTPHGVPPWFWSDQYALKLQMTGFVTPEAQTLLRGTPEEGAFSVLHLQGDRLLAAFSVNRAGDHMASRRLIAARTPLDLGLAADPAVPLAKALKPQEISA